MRAKSDQVEATDIAIVVLPADLPNVAVSIRSHQLVELLSQSVHGFSKLLSLCVSEKKKKKKVRDDYTDLGLFSNSDRDLD